MKHVDHIVLDVEIAKPIEECSDEWNSTDEMGVGVAVVYEYNSNRYCVYGPEDVGDLRERITQATRVTGYNSMMFDLPVVFGIAKAFRQRHVVGYVIGPAAQAIPLLHADTCRVPVECFGSGWRE